MAVDALSGMVSALSVAAAAATSAKGSDAAAAEKYRNRDAGEAELAETVLRGIKIDFTFPLHLQSPRLSSSIPPSIMPPQR